MYYKTVYDEDPVKRPTSVVYYLLKGTKKTTTTSAPNLLIDTEQIRRISSIQFSSKKNQLFYLSLDHKGKTAISRISLGDKDMESEIVSKKFSKPSSEACAKRNFERHQKLKLEKSNQDYLALQYNQKKIMIMREEESKNSEKILKLKGVIKLTKGSRISDFACFAYQKIICVSEDGFICPFLFNNSEFKRLKSPKLGLGETEVLTGVKNCEKQRYFCVVSSTKNGQKSEILPYKIYLFYMSYDFEVSFLSYISLQSFGIENRSFCDYCLVYKEPQKKTLVLLIGTNDTIHGFVKREKGALVQAKNFNFHRIDFRRFGKVACLDDTYCKLKVTSLEGNWASIFELRYDFD